MTCDLPDPYRLRQFLGDRFLAITAYANEEGAPNGAALDHLCARAGTYPQLAQVTQGSGVGVRHAIDRRGLSVVGCPQRERTEDREQPDTVAELVEPGGRPPCRGIEVGHIFKFGARYSEPLGATYLDEHGKEHELLPHEWELVAEEKEIEVRQPGDLGEMYYFLTTPESAAITGQTFHVNGGVVM